MMADWNNWERVCEQVCRDTCLIFNLAARKSVVRYGFKWQDGKAVVFQRRPKPFLRRVDVLDDKRYLLFYMDYEVGKMFEVHARLGKDMANLLPCFYDRKNPLYKYKGRARFIRHDSWPPIMGGTEKHFRMAQEIRELLEAKKFSQKLSRKAYEEWFLYQLSLRLSKKEFMRAQGVSAEEYAQIVSYKICEDR